MIFRHFFAAAALWLAAVTTTQASTIDGNGATNVLVDGFFYDVVFTDGSCASVFEDCNSTADFFFTSLEEAAAATDALLSLIAGSAIANTPTAVNGCFLAPPAVCFIDTPYSLADDRYRAASLFVRADLPPFFAGDDVRDLIGVNRPNVTFAVWANAENPTPIPLPAGLPLALTGLAGFAGLRVRMRKQPKAQD